MADTDVADMKGNETNALPEQEKPVAEATGDNEAMAIEEPSIEKAGTEEE